MPKPHSAITASPALHRRAQRRGEPIASPKLPCQSGAGLPEFLREFLAAAQRPCPFFPQGRKERWQRDICRTNSPPLGRSTTPDFPRHFAPPLLAPASSSPAF